MYRELGSFLILWRNQFLLLMTEGVDQENALWTQDLMKVRRNEEKELQGRP